MPTPRIPHSLSILFDNAVVGGVVTLINRTNGNVLRKSMNVDGRLTVSAADFTDGYTNGDVIQIQASGAQFGSTTVTIATGTPIQNVSITTTTTSTTNTPAVNL